MSKTIFITGTSSGIGQAIVEKFLFEGWSVVATLRNFTESTFDKHERLLVMEMDVTNDQQIDQAYKKALARFKTIDVLVNNAGYGLLGPHEALTKQQIKDQFDVNVFGVMEVTRRFIPHMRANKSGVVIAISSMYGKISMPYFSSYAASKQAIEGWSESLQHELLDFGIGIKIIEPGTIKTNFFKNAVLARGNSLGDYQPRFNTFMRSVASKGSSGDEASVVAKYVYAAATKRSTRLRYVTDKTARLLVSLHRWLPFAYYEKAIRKNVG